MNIFKNYFSNNPFSKNVLILMVGTSIAQSIPIIVSLILTRLYTPEQFGILGLYIAITSVLSVIVTGKYELAIMLPEKKQESDDLTILALLLTTIISVIILLIIIIFKKYILVLLGNDEISFWLYFIPLTVFFSGVYNSLNYKLNKEKEYKTISISKIYQTTTSSTTSVLLGFFKKVDVGLIIANIIGDFSKTLSLVLNINVKKLKKNSNKKRMFLLAKKYNKFPKFTVPHSLFNSVATNLPVFVITYYFSSKETGFFTFTKRIVLLPINLISSSYYQVYFENFSKKSTNRLNLFKKKFRQVNFLFLPIIICIWFFIPNILSFAYGKEWDIIGIYAQILIPLYYMKLLSGIFTTTTYIYYEKQLENFILEIIITSLILTSLVVGALNQNILLGLKLMVISNSIIIVFKIYRSILFIKQEIR